jgi:hypothetical protein
MIACVLLAAHFFRAGNIGLVAASVLPALLLLIKKRWSFILVQVWAYAGAAVWLHTITNIVQERMMFGRPWKVAAIILGSVTLFTAFAGLLLNSRVVKDKYPS